MIHSAMSLVVAAVAAAAAGAVNALAGGGTLISFPVLTALGLPAVSANVTNTVALLPGYLGGAWAQRAVLSRPEQRTRIVAFVAAGLIGGLGGAFLLFATGEALFKIIIPYLIIGASLLLAFGERIKRALASRPGSGSAATRRSGALWALLAVAAASVYGGYFGAGMSVIVLAVLGIAVEGSLPEINALKQVVSLSCNFSAAIAFCLSGRVEWPFAAAMAASALAGGAVGGALAGRLKASVLRATVVCIGLGIGAYYLVAAR